MNIFTLFQIFKQQLLGHHYSFLSTMYIVTKLQREPPAAGAFIAWVGEIFDRKGRLSRKRYDIGPCL